MQGGRSDSSVLGRWGRIPGTISSGDESGYESELNVMGKPLSLGQILDNVLHNVRLGFAVAISLPVAWMTGHISIGVFRSRKLDMVETGTDTVVQLQRRLRSPVADVYFQICSFLAEEEAYLFALPFLIWNVDRVLGRRLTMIVNGGLIVGNIMKDVFELPRPSSPPVWRPSHQEAVDSSNLKDFGFPSTHAMNSVTNSLMVFLYYCAIPGSLDVMEIIGDKDNRPFIGLVAIYIISLCTSRLYLGAHSPTDLRGGIILGFVLTALYFPFCDVIDVSLLTTPLLLVKSLLAVFVILLVNPQPRPVTPTFSQNALCAGLLLGAVFGCRAYNDQGPVPALDTTFVGMLTALHPYIKLALRTVLGYVVVIILRIVAKKIIVTVLCMLGMRLTPVVVDTLSPKQLGTKKDRSRKQKVSQNLASTQRKTKVRLFTRDIDIIGTALVKVFVYSVLAWSITYVVPILHCVLGLSTFQPDVVAVI